MSSFFGSVEEFVEFSGGDHAIKKILIANNGIGAVKAIRSIRRWSYETFGNERMIEFVVMATPEDLKANAEYIRMADEVVDVPGGTNNNNYANINLICEIAERHVVDAVMPMWGHASENPNLPTSLAKLAHKVTFIGPPAEPMLALGDKIGSTIIAQSAGVPTISWNGDSLFVDYASTGIPEHIYDAANVKTPEDALECALRIGFPVMIKASEGGGGKGIRKVVDAEQVANAFRQVQGEIPGSPIFVMKMASAARHLEVQLLADKYGDAIALSGRDCSVQRRHQKIIEEGPPIAAPKDVFRKMEAAACALARTVGYINAGTVEYLFMDETQEFAFLELNPRLQVEHPVTENILGLNLPSCQLQVAMGLPLCRIGDIRKMYGRHPRGRDTIDFEFTERAVPPRHCIAVRVTAENPDSGFQPTSGRIRELQFRSSIDVWGYFSVNNSGSIHEFADSQFGHIFASGSNRENARRAMIVALKEMEIRGDIRTTIEYIIKMLQSNDFIENRIDTLWLDNRIARHNELKLLEDIKFSPPATLVATCGAALKGFQHFEKNGEEFVRLLRVGQVPPREILANIVKVDLIYNNFKYCTSVIQNGSNSVVVECLDDFQTVTIKILADGGFLLNVGGKSHLLYANDESGGYLRMILDGHTCIFTPEYDPTKLRSTVAGKIARLLVADGAHVNAGDSYVEIEVMKMYMPLKALEAGIVTFQKSEGATLSPGDIIATVSLDEPDKVVQAEVFSGQLSSWLFDSKSVSSFQSSVFDNNSPRAVESKPHLKMRLAKKRLEHVLEGYSVTSDAISESIFDYIESLSDRRLPALEMEEAISILRGRIDATLTQTIVGANTQYLKLVVSCTTSSPVSYPSELILTSIYQYAQSQPFEKRNAFHQQIAPIWNIAESSLFSLEVRIVAALLKLIESYLDVEKLFDSMSFTDVVNNLRKENVGNLDRVISLCRSHLNVKAKNVVLLKVLEALKLYPISKIIQQRPRVIPGIPIRNDLNIRNIKIRLNDLTKLRQPAYSQVSFAASVLSIEQYSITTELRRQKLNDAIIAALTTGDPVGVGDRANEIKKFIDSNIAIRELILEFLRHDSDYQVAVMELYLRRIYQKTHNLKNMKSGKSLIGNGEADGLASNPWIQFEFMTMSAEVPQDVLEGTDSSDINTLIKKNSSWESFRRPLVRGNRMGIIVKVDYFDDLPALLPLIVAKFPVHDKNTDPVHAVHIVVLESWAVGVSDDDAGIKLHNILVNVAEGLTNHGIRRITFFVGKPVASMNIKSILEQRIQGIAPSVASSSASLQPTIYTFRSKYGFLEDRLFRHIEPPHAFHLDLPRLSNFSISLEKSSQSFAGSVHLYRGVPHDGKGPRRYFARLVTFSADFQNADAESILVDGIDQLGIVIGREDSKLLQGQSGGNHIFLNVVTPDTVVNTEKLVGEIRRMCDKYWMRMTRLSVFEVEIRLACRLSSSSDSVSLRFVASNPTGFVLRVDQYIETISLSHGVSQLKSIGGAKGPWDGQSSRAPYPVVQPFEKQRTEAMISSETLYVYDWPTVFEFAVQKQMCDCSLSSSSPSFQIEELVLCDPETMSPLPKGWSSKDAEKAVLVPMSRIPGLNECGMVAWMITYQAPESPSGRSFVLICNDITFQAGSFGTKEDMMFFKASEFARSRNLPRIFLAANSGARIGMAQSLKSLFQVCWTEPSDPSKGYRYIYLSENSYDKLLEKYNGDVNSLPLICNRQATESGEVHYVITDIIGEESDLGVENLMGSGLIAGETSRAYDDIFTLTLVVGRTVGIGAYLVRLGQRTIQKTRNSPIILTGYQALNKLMGREIYTTNDQLGGPMIMYPNGVAHLLAETHLDSVRKALQWMSFVPSYKGAPLPVVDISRYDVIERKVDFAPPNGLPYDPRLLLAGEFISDSIWRSGFFDKNSFVEFLSGWAKTVVVGRARLGGLPMGVIVTENRTSEACKPADPADVTSQEKMVQQAGGVWFPDSAYKTAQALKDFSREGLPCLIMANWRGFSGGQRDMFDEVLKFGSMIVDALVSYQQPLFVYIPPFAELRGGAWVVVDSTINADVMEFYAAENARGGVLEATGAASIKFREKDIITMAHRVDPQLKAWDQQLSKLKESHSADARDLERQIHHREKMLFGVFQQIAVHFADLHDTPGRMKAKGVIRKQVQWEDSRSFFYWRLKRRLIEFDVIKEVSSSQKNSKLEPGVKKTIVNNIQDWMISRNLEETWEDDKAFVHWMSDNKILFQSFITEKKSEALAGNLMEGFRQLISLHDENEDGSSLSSRIMASALKQMSVEEREKLKKLLGSSIQEMN